MFISCNVTRYDFLHRTYLYSWVSGREKQDLEMKGPLPAASERGDGSSCSSAIAAYTIYS